MTDRDRAKIAFGIALGSAQLACGQATSSLVIRGVTPEQGYTDGPLVLQVDAGKVRPALRVDVSRSVLVAEVASMTLTLVPDDADGLSPGPAVRLETLDWDGGDFSWWAKTPPGLAAAKYTLEIIDQHGQVGRLPGAFTALGPDPAPPTIDLPSLATGPYVGAGTKAQIQIVANDGLGAVAMIHWMTSEGAAGDCPPIKIDGTPIDIRARSPSRLTCVAAFDAPQLDDADPPLVPFLFWVTAQDVSGQQTALETEVFRAKRPQIESFSGVLGSLGGYQPFAVRGQFFLPGSRVLIGGTEISAMASGGDRQDDRSIVGWTPPHGRAEPVSVEIRSAVGSVIANTPFNYVAPPRLRDIQPSVGPAHGGIHVTVRGNDLRQGVMVYVGATRDARQPLYNVTYDAQNKVVGCLPPGTGTVSLWAYDPVTGDGEWPMAFTYQDSGAVPLTDPACLVPPE